MQNYRFKNFYQMLKHNANVSPRKTVIYDGEIKISNKCLQAKVDQVAGFLIKQGINPRDKVALIMSNCYEFVVNLFAISKIGAIAVPVNNFLKEEEFAYILNDSEAKLAFISDKFAKDAENLINKTKLSKVIWLGKTPSIDERFLSYSSITDLPQEEYQDIVEYDAQINDCAITIYTSGTTGKPKGAMLSYKNIFSNCEGCKHLMNIKDGEIDLLCYLPMFHAFTLTVTVILPVYAKSSIIIIRSISSKKDFKYLLKQLLLKRCRYFTGVPEIYGAMVRVKLPWYFHWFHNVKGFISGASALSQELEEKFSKSFKRGKLLQGYGISECSPVVSCNSLTNYRGGSVGKPLVGYSVKICDENMNELPIGEFGEICIKGDCVMLGYYNKEEETRGAIVDGWFRTGDIGYVDKDGYIYIVDRKKDLIIHKGMNIYPREIEEVILTHDKINAVAVVGIKDKEEVEVPVAYIELKENVNASESEIKDFLRSKLATFKLPRKIIFMEKLPRNATGKILKRELREKNLTH